MRCHTNRIDCPDLRPEWYSTRQNRQQIASSATKTADSGKATVCTTKLTFAPRQNTATAQQDGGWLEGVWKKQHGPKNVSIIAFYFWRAAVVVDIDTQWLNNIDFTLSSSWRVQRSSTLWNVAQGSVRTSCSYCSYKWARCPWTRQFGFKWIQVISFQS